VGRPKSAGQTEISRPAEILFGKKLRLAIITSDRQGLLEVIG
jgi:hypothetical protein